LINIYIINIHLPSSSTSQRPTDTESRCKNVLLVRALFPFFFLSLLAAIRHGIALKSILHFPSSFTSQRLTDMESRCKNVLLVKELFPYFFLSLLAAIRHVIALKMYYTLSFFLYLTAADRHGIALQECITCIGTLSLFLPFFVSGHHTWNHA
jgi:hypothetical protein